MRRTRRWRWRAASLASLVLAGALRADARADAPPDPHAPAPPPSSPALALAALDRRLADLEVQAADEKRALEDTGVRIARVHDRVVHRGRALYRATRAGMLPVGGGFEALVSHAMRVERMRHEVAGDLDAERALRGQAADLARTLEQVARDQVALSAQRSALDAERSAVEDESRRQRAFDRAFDGAAADTDYVAVYGGGASDEESSAAGFAAARGRLLFPVAGRAEARPAHREGTDGPGLEIRAPSGSVVRAVFGGHIAFADRYGPYGRIVIVDHGEHYYSVSGNLGSIDVRVGDDVSAGGRLGTVGDDGAGPMLYFEIRHGTETVPPGPWIGLR